MKTNYDKIINHLKICLFELGDNFKGTVIKNKIKNLISEIEDIKNKQKKLKKEKQSTINNIISKNPKKSIEIIDKMIEEEINE